MANIRENKNNKDEIRESAQLDLFDPVLKKTKSTKSIPKVHSRQINYKFVETFCLTGFSRGKLPSKTRERARDDFEFFCNYYLGKYFSVKSADYQKSIISVLNSRYISEENCNILESAIRKEEYKSYLKKNSIINGIIDCEPRNFGKSVRMSFAYPLWCLLFDKEPYILIFSANKSMAHSHISNIKFEIENNERILNDFGDRILRKANQSSLETESGSLIYSLGIGSAIRGTRNRHHRPSLIILDDVSDSKNATNLNMREKTYNWFKSVVLPLSKDGFIVMINTILHADDLPSRLLKEIKSGKFKNFVGLHLSCYDKNGNSIWEDMWNKDALKRKELELGDRAFSTEMLNEPSKDEKIVQNEWINVYEQMQISGDIFMGIDPSCGIHDRASIVVAQKQNNKYYILDFFNKTVSPSEFSSIVVDFYKKYNPKCCLFESTGYQETIRKQVIDLGLTQNLKMNIRGIKPTNSKEQRLLDIIFLLENGKILFKTSTNELVYQLLDFPHSEYDDLVDALIYCIKADDIAEKQIVIV